MKKLLAIALFSLLAMFFLTASMHYIDNRQAVTLYDDTVFEDTVVTIQPYDFRPAVDREHMTLFVQNADATDDSVSLVLQGTIRSDSTAIGWQTLRTDTFVLLADTVAFVKYDIDTLTTFDLYRWQLTEFDGSDTDVCTATLLTR